MDEIKLQKTIIKLCMQIEMKYQWSFEIESCMTVKGNSQLLMKNFVFFI
jgi:hypothetical protein